MAAIIIMKSANRGQETHYISISSSLVLSLSFYLIKHIFGTFKMANTFTLSQHYSFYLSLKDIAKIS